jgi:hypothetical protein
MSNFSPRDPGSCRDENIPLISGFLLFFSKIFGNKMCQTSSKQPENEGILVLYKEFRLFRQ